MASEQDMEDSWMGTPQVANYVDQRLDGPKARGDRFQNPAPRVGYAGPRGPRGRPSDYLDGDSDNEITPPYYDKRSSACVN